MKVLFILPKHPPFFIKFLPEFEPYAFVVLATMIQDLAEVQAIDMRFEKKSALIAKLKTFQPDVIGIRAHTAADTESVIQVSTLCKKIVPQSKIIIGGQCATMQPDDFNVPSVDFLCMGHGDKTFREFIEALIHHRDLHTIPGLGIMENGQVHLNAHREILPGRFAWPPMKRDLLEKYIPKYDAQIVISSIGCPFRCNFCSLWVMAEGNYLLREPEDIVRDIESCQHPWVHFGDDNTFHNYNHALKIYELIKQRGIKKRLTAYARTDTIVKYPDIFEKWASIGLQEIVVGFETFKEETLTSINKRTDAENNIKAYEILTRCGINALAHFIIFPEYTHEDFKDLWKYLDKHNFSDPIFPLMTPLPGTGQFENAKRKRLLTMFDLNFYNLEYMVMKTKMPKLVWYFESIMLWVKTILPTTFWKRHKYAKWPLKLYLTRLRKLIGVLSFYSVSVFYQFFAESRFGRWTQKDALRRKSFEPDYISPFSNRVTRKLAAAETKVA